MALTARVELTFLMPIEKFMELAGAEINEDGLFYFTAATDVFTEARLEFERRLCADTDGRITHWHWHIESGDYKENW